MIAEMGKHLWGEKKRRKKTQVLLSTVVTTEGKDVSKRVRTASSSGLRGPCLCRCPRARLAAPGTGSPLRVRPWTVCASKHGCDLAERACWGFLLQAAAVAAAREPCAHVSRVFPHLPRAERKGSCLRLLGVRDSLFGSELLWLPGSSLGYK